MIKCIFTLVFILSFSGNLWAKSAQGQRLPHMDLDMTGSEYLPFLQARQAQVGATDFIFEELQDILDVGKRNLDWLTFINKNRDAQHQLSFSSAATQGASPMDKPRNYNPELIRAAYNDLLSKLPTSIKSIVVDSQPFTKDPPMPDDQYIAWGLLVDSSYQIAARWITMEPYLADLEMRKSDDVRGYYFLSQLSDVQKTLSGFGTLDPATQKLYSGYLVQMCLNNGGAPNCDGAIATAVAQNKVYELYSTYLPVSKKHYDDYFVVQVSRTDVNWKNPPGEEMHVPFTDPQNATIKSFLADNIQAEWQWSTWKLLLDFGPVADGRPKVDFEPGVTPHVEALAGNTITMDSNQPLTEYNVNWTIRHEFGHVLGFPDCYLEFYDSGTNIITSYQIDITNLMCSRRGHIKDVHYNALKAAYQH